MAIEISERNSADLNIIKSQLNDNKVPPSKIRDITFGEVQFDFEKDEIAIQEKQAQLRIAKCTETDEYAGFVIVYPEQGEIAKVYVNPKFRRMGIGTLLVNQAENTVPEGVLLFADTIGGEQIQSILLKAGYQFTDDQKPYRVTKSH